MYIKKELKSIKFSYFVFEKMVLNLNYKLFLYSIFPLINK